MIAGLGAEASRLLRGRYPDFVYGRGSSPPGGAYLPIFTFHTLDPDGFGAKLRHLDENEYRTLTLDEALAHVRGDDPAGPRSVVLTVDDGRLSTWTVGLPLLRRYGMHATAFVIPAYLGDGPPRPTLEDGDPAGGTGGRLTEERDVGTSLRWSEVERLHASDAVDVQSHTWMHKRVAVSRRLVGFVTPGAGRAAYDVPCSAAAASPEEADEGARGLGAPVFEHEPILSVDAALEPPEEMVTACVDRVREGGGAAFFDRPGWRRELRRIVRDRDGAFRRVDLEPHQRRELRAARRALAERLPGAHVRHLCLPSGQGSDRAVRLARETGHDTVLWGFLPADGTNRPGGDPRRLGRLKHDFVFRLPGHGRRRLLRVVAEKAARRARGDTGF